MKSHCKRDLPTVNGALRDATAHRFEPARAHILGASFTPSPASRCQWGVRGRYTWVQARASSEALSTTWGDSCVSKVKGKMRPTVPATALKKKNASRGRPAGQVATRDNILRAAIDIFAKNGFAGARVEKISH